MEEKNKIRNLSGIWNVSLKDHSKFQMRLPGTLKGNNIRVSKENEGATCIFTTLSFFEGLHKRYFIEAERGRQLSLLIDGKKIPPFRPITLATPAVFEVTGKINGVHEIAFISDNSYEDWPKERILSSDMANEKTQTNWNGILGAIRIREEEETFVENARVITNKEEVEVILTVSSDSEQILKIELDSEWFTDKAQEKIALRTGRNEIRIRGMKLKNEIFPEPQDQTKTGKLRIRLGQSEKTISFGIRSFTVKENRFFLNGRTFFLRGETNRGIFGDGPEPPTDLNSWKQVFSIYQSYGCNFVRFSSYCPPEAAFFAADEQGMLLEVSLSLADGNFSESEKAEKYYADEAELILSEYGNHPSFCIFSFGGIKEPLSKKWNNIRKRFIEQGILTESANDLSGLFFDVGKESSLSDETDIAFLNRTSLITASGEFMQKRWQEEIENSFLSQTCSGILLYGLQNYPAGNHYGMLTENFMQRPYDFASPARFLKSFSDCVLLLKAKKKNCYYKETPEFEIWIRNDSDEEKKGELYWNLIYQRRTFFTSEKISLTVLPHTLVKAAKGTVEFPEEIKNQEKISRISMDVRFFDLQKEENFRFYPKEFPLTPDSIFETRRLTEEVFSRLSEGQSVFLHCAQKEAVAAAVSLDRTHPLFENMEIDGSYDERFGLLGKAKGHNLPEFIKPIAGRLSAHSEIKNEGILWEASVLNGAVFVSSFSFFDQLNSPEYAIFLKEIYEYLASVDFSPKAELTKEELIKIIGLGYERERV